MRMCIVLLENWIQFLQSHCCMLTFAMSLVGYFHLAELGSNYHWTFVPQYKLYSPVIGDLGVCCHLPPALSVTWVEHSHSSIKAFLALRNQ